MKTKNITFADIIKTYTDEQNPDAYKILRKKAPLHEVILNAVIRHHPNPTVAQAYRIPKIWHGELDSTDGKALCSCDPKGPLFFVITKVVVDPQAGEISAGRLFSGTLQKGTPVHLNRAKQGARVQQVFIYNGAKREIVEQAVCGNIIGIAGVKGFPGETITLEPSEPFEEITHIFDPVVTKSIEAKHPSDLPKLVEVLRQVAKEDPTIRIEINEETGENLMSGMGELHLEVIENRIRANKGLDVVTSSPIVVYRETVTRESSEEFEGKSPNKHNKLYFRIRPLPADVQTKLRSGEISQGRIKKKDLGLRDTFVSLGYDTKEADKIKDVYNGNIFIDKTRGIVYINEIMELVLDMFEDVMRAGSLAREPCINVEVSLMDCKLHEDAIHRGPAQMYPAVREGIRGAIMNARPVIFEPVQTMQFEAPDEFMGEISKLIANKRGQLLEMNQEGSQVIVRGKLPVAEMFGMASNLRSATGGRGTSSMVDQSYEKLPDELQQKIIMQIRSRKGLSENQ